MTDSSHKPEHVFEGDYRYFPRTKNSENNSFIQKKMDPNGKVSVRGIFYFILMSTCPDDDDVNWCMRAICDQNHVDRADVQTDEEQAR